MSGFFSRLFAGGSTGQEARLEELVESVVQTADPRIRQVRGHVKKLAPAVARAEDYCASLLDEIPGPVEIGHNQYHAVPLVRAVFTSADQVEEVLRAALRHEPLPDGEDAGFGLLTMTKTERTIYGHARQDEMLVGDVARRSVNFVDHRILGLSTEFESCRAILRDRGVVFLARTAQEKIAGLRAEVTEQRDTVSQLQSMRHILGSRDRAAGMFAPPSHGTQNKINEINEKLATREEELRQAHGRIAEPEDSLALLVDLLNHPEKHFFQALETLRLDWMNVLVSNDEEGNTITLARLTGAGGVSRWAVLVRFSAAAPGEI